MVDFSKYLKGASVAKAKATGTEIQKWDAEMAAIAAKSAATAATASSGSKRIGTRGGFTIDGNKVKDNKLHLVVVAGILENAWYEGKFDPDNFTSPSCFAFGEDAKAMVPDPTSLKVQNVDCATCPKNRFGSADTGKGKACKNQWRLLVATEGEMLKDPRTATKRLLILPPTSAPFYTTYVKNLNDTVRRDPAFVITTFTWETDPDTQFKITPELKTEIPVGAVIGEIIKVREMEMKTIAQPYDKPKEPEAKKGPVKAGKFAKTGAPAKKAGKR